MIVTICYIAECFTFGKEPELENIDINYQKKRIIDLFLGLISLKWAIYALIFINCYKKINKVW